MGRRSTNTTKSGKYMNPTDRARKEARRRELKKNKKQRMAVRQAVLKSKDASLLLEEAALYDQQEYDPKSLSTLSERVLQEKRKKLLETYDRMITLYRKEDPEKASDLQIMRNDYERKRNEMILFYEQVKLAEKVKANEIPLPEIPPQNITGLPQFPGDIPLPPGLNVPPHPAVLAAAAMATTSFPPPKSILKKAEQLIPGPPPGLPTLHKKPCAPPPGTPDELSDAENSDEESIDALRETADAKPRKIRFLDDDQYDPTKDVEKDTRLTMQKALNILELPQIHQVSLLPPPGFMQPNRIPMPPTIPPPIPIVGAPGLHPAPTSIAMPPQIFGQPAKPRQLPTIAAAAAKKAAEATAQSKKSAVGIPTIEAKPQLKNLIGDSTKLVPTSLRLRKTKPSTARISSIYGISRPEPGLHKTDISASKDDAYDQFMKEMEGLL